MKTVIIVPEMYDERDVEEILGNVPMDYQKTSIEFWSYIVERLKQLEPSIREIYLVICGDTPEPRATYIPSLLEKGRVKVHRLDKAFAGEARAWYFSGQSARTGIGEEFLSEISREVSETLGIIMDSSLEDGELGLVFFEPALRLSFREGVRVIRMSPFDPLDYVNRHLAVRRK